MAMIEREQARKRRDQDGICDGYVALDQAERKWNLKPLAQINRLAARLNDQTLREQVDALMKHSTSWGTVMRTELYPDFDSKNGFLARLFEEVGEQHGQLTQRFGELVRRPWL
jgi:hypothetical protein